MRQNKNKPPMTISITFLYILGNGFFLSISHMIVHRKAKKIWIYSMEKKCLSTNEISG